jgi:hypothetical protein
MAVHHSSQRTAELVRQDSSFAEKQDSHPARLLIVRLDSELGFDPAAAGARLCIERAASAAFAAVWSRQVTRIG